LWKLKCWCFFWSVKIAGNFSFEEFIWKSFSNSSSQKSLSKNRLIFRVFHPLSKKNFKKIFRFYFKIAWRDINLNFLWFFFKLLKFWESRKRFRNIFTQEFGNFESSPIQTIYDGNCWTHSTPKPSSAMNNLKFVGSENRLIKKHSKSTKIPENYSTDSA
jgi:hypothetical protein